MAMSKKEKDMFKDIMKPFLNRTTLSTKTSERKDMNARIVNASELMKQIKEEKFLAIKRPVFYPPADDVLVTKLEEYIKYVKFLSEKIFSDATIKELKLCDRAKFNWKNIELASGYFHKNMDHLYLHVLRDTDLNMTTRKILGKKIKTEWSLLDTNFNIYRVGTPEYDELMTKLKRKSADATSFTYPYYKISLKMFEELFHVVDNWIVYAFDLYDADADELGILRLGNIEIYNTDNANQIRALNQLWQRYIALKTLFTMKVFPKK